jgi:hypothetical protein
MILLYVHIYFDYILSYNNNELKCSLFKDLNDDHSMTETTW